MAYPERSVLMGTNIDAWFTAGLGSMPARALVESGGLQLIRSVQTALANQLALYSEVLPRDVVIPTSGRWDAATARATLLLADKSGALKNAYDADYIDSAWGEYYKHRFDVRLTTLALAIFVNDSQFVRQVDNALFFPRAEQPGSTYNVELSHDAILPRWDTAPRVDELHDAFAVSARRIG